jgi:FkbM family methyltransferase
LNKGSLLNGTETKMKYSIVIPTYNHCDDLLKPCIESVFKYTNISDIELVISANGCTDNTKEYLIELKQKYEYLGLNDNLKIVYSEQPLGYSKACNVGIEVSTTDYIVLMNNDLVLMPQERNHWLELFQRQFDINEKCGISCIIKSMSEPAGKEFAIFFLVMIHRKVFDKIGLLNTEYGVGGGEDTEFSIEAENAGFEVCVATNLIWNDEKKIYTGHFPVYHIGEGTMHDPNLVPDWSEIFLTNSLKLAKKYNPKWYQWRLSNYWERAVIFKGDIVPDRETTRYKWASENLVGENIFELGCTSGYGIQFLPKNIKYTGVDYDKRVIEAAKEQDWGYDAEFINCDINNFELQQYDTIIAFEVIEHLDNGLEIVEKLKKHCKRLMITVPMLEPFGKWGPHHKLHMLDESFFPGFKFKFIAPDGSLRDEPHMRGDPDNINLMLCIYDNVENQESSSSDSQLDLDLSFLETQNKEIYDEVITDNCYRITKDTIENKYVIDIGSNIGVFALLAGKYNAKKVFAFEPVSSTFMQLCSNINKSKLTNIVPFKNIVSDKDNEFMQISLLEESGHNSLYSNSDSYETVQTTCLRNILSMTEGNDIVLKIDCEGSEYDILLSSSIEDLNRIGTIIMEVHADLHPNYKGFDIIHDKLQNAGFTLNNFTQIYSWDINEKGEQTNIKPIPVRIEHWKK